MKMVDLGGQARWWQSLLPRCLADNMEGSAADFSTALTVKVVEGITTEITDWNFSEKILVYNGEDITVYPKVAPLNAYYYMSEWSFDRPEAPSTGQGFITTNQVGTCIITYWSPVRVWVCRWLHNFDCSQIVRLSQLLIFLWYTSLEQDYVLQRLIFGLTKIWPCMPLFE